MPDPTVPVPPPEGAPTPSTGATIEPPVSSIRTIQIVRWGMALWAVALVVVLLTPSLRAGDRDWWVWVPVAGLVLGAVGHLYIARGRGNAAGS